MGRRPSAHSLEAVRRRQLIEATIDTLADIGFKAASLSEIARRADVSTGLFAHYFGDKDGLLEATLRFMAARLARTTALRLAAATTPRERLFAVGDAALADEQFDQRTSAVWLAFWGQITHSARYRRVQHIYQRRMITNLRHILRRLVPADCVDLQATMIAAMIDGLWLRSHAPEGSVPAGGVVASEARMVVRAFIDGLLARPSRDSTDRFEAPNAIGAVQIATAAQPILRRSPGTGEEAASFVPARAQEIRRAARDAHRAVTAWQAVGAGDRAQVLRRCVDLLRAGGQDLARLESSETGRPVLHTAGLDLRDASRLLEYAAGRAEQAASTWTELRGGRLGQIRQRPAGIVAAAGHWATAVHDLCRQAVGLAFGNAVVFAADAHATETSLHLAALFARAGLPDGVLTVLRGDAETKRLLRTHPGLIPEADQMGEEAAGDVGAGRGRRKACTIVLPGADPARAAATILQGSRRWTGSSFSGQSRIYVHVDARPNLLEALRALADRMRLGDPLDPSTQVGPLLSPAHAAGLDGALRADLAAGAVLVTGGREPARNPTAAQWRRPMVLDRCTASMRLVQGHSFAPVVAVVPFEDDDDLVRLVDRRGDEGPDLGVIGGDPSRALRTAERLGAALCVINGDEVVTNIDDVDGLPTYPFGWSALDLASRGSSRTTLIIQ